MSRALLLLVLCAMPVYGVVNDGNGNITLYQTGDGLPDGTPSSYANIYVADSFGNSMGIPVNTAAGVPYNYIVLMKSGRASSSADQLNSVNWGNILMSPIGEYTTDNIVLESRVSTPDFQFSLQVDVSNDVSTHAGHTLFIDRALEGPTIYNYSSQDGTSYRLTIFAKDLPATVIQ